MPKDDATLSAASVGSKPLTFGSLFAGIGGFDLGLERAGMRCEWQVEKDEYAASVLAKHWPSVRRWGDVETFPPNDGGSWKVDLICGGVPCQPVSLAGKKKGAADERWMWGEFLRVVAALGPRIVVAENPTSILSNDRGRTFAGILSAIRSAGYGVEWHTVSARDVGAPHRRDRVFVVGRKEPGMGEMPMLRELPLHDTWGARSRLPMPSDRGMEREPIRAQDDLADASGTGLQGAVLEHPGEGLSRPRSRAWRDEDEEVSDAFTGWRPTEPGVCRMAHGVPNRVDRLRCLGNAIVPQVAEVIGRAIVEAA
jgi:DNA (cytosine-5)-methyltransferase 1